MFRRDYTADASVLLEDFKAYVVECHPEADLVLLVADLADFGVDLTFLGPVSRLTRPGGIDLV